MSLFFVFADRALALVAEHGLVEPVKLGKETTTLVISTEGATDPAARERIVGRQPEEG